MYNWKELMENLEQSAINLYADIPTKFEESLTSYTIEQVKEFVMVNSPNEKDEFKDLIPICGVLNSYGYEEDAEVHLVNPYTGKFYSVHGSHCSCYGFEDQFKLEENPVKYLMTTQYASHIKKVVEYFANKMAA